MTVVNRFTYALLELGYRAERRPAHFMRWLPPQDAFLRDPSKLKLYRAGNQSLGKTTAGLTQVIFHCLGEHPYYDVPPPPVEWWIICESQDQSINIQKKLWELLPKEHLDPQTEFDEVRGFRGRQAACVFANGSIIRIRTNNQGAMRMAGATIDGALFDEPPKNQRLFEEIRKRVKKRAGWVVLTMTPVNRDCSWVREMCEQGIMVDHHFPLRPEYLIPIGAMFPIRDREGRFCDAEWVKELEEETLEHERPVTVHGEWEMRATDRILRAFRSGGEQGHVHRRVPRGELKLCLGIDHGTKVGKQMAVLVVVAEPPPGADEPPRVFVLDETAAPEESTPDQDAKAILAMLARHKFGGRRLEWSNLDEVWGDRVYMRGSHHRKSNRDLHKAIARQLGRTPDKVKPGIRTVKRGAGHGAGSVMEGARFLHFQMVRGPDFFGVHPRCKKLIESIDKWDTPHKDSEWKDAVDSLRYALDSYIFGAHSRRGSRRVVGVR